MSGAFLTEDFLLESEPARILYHEHARSLPIIDYHCHLDPQELADDTRFESMTALWLAHDHYKWRAMRAHGIAERCITGDASDWEKFSAWAETIPHTLRNPLYHWTHMELARPFEVHRTLSPATAREIYDQCNERLSEKSFSARGLLESFRVETVCTTDDPTDTLEFHVRAQNDPTGRTRLLPTFRPDLALAIQDPASFTPWLTKLESVAGKSITTYDDLLAALDQRHAYFHQVGGRLSDHGVTRLDSGDFSLADVRQTFRSARARKPIVAAQASAYRSAVLHELCLMNHERGWVQQLHLGPFRNLNSRRKNALGPNSGFDAMGDHSLGRPLSRLLDRLDQTDQLAKTIVYNSNPRDNELVATILGCFQGGTPGKMQLGSAWWFLDQLDGMEKQIDTVSNHGLLSHFVGMLTDSRSLLSFSRHDYFRRLLCNLIGRDVERGLLPRDLSALGALVERVSYGNAKEYFPFRTSSENT